MNATSWLGPIEMVQPLYGYLMPLLMLVTFVSNSLIIRVLSRVSMSSPTNTVLLAMAVCDLLTILLPCPWYVYFFTLNSHQTVDWTISLCDIFENSLETTPQIFHTASNWLTMTLAIQGHSQFDHWPCKILSQVSFH